MEEVQDTLDAGLEDLTESHQENLEPVAPETETERGATTETAEATGSVEMADSGIQESTDSSSVEESIEIGFVEDAPAIDSSATLKAVLEAIVYVTDEPLTAEQIASGLDQPLDRVNEALAELVADFAAPQRGLLIREVAGGYKMSTKPEHHESIRRFVKRLQPPLKLSLPALETLAVIAYKQPITAPEVLEIRGVQGAGVLKTLLDRKLIAAAGRKNVLGKPIMYKTTREFLIQFGLNSLAELPTLKEFEELGRLALTDSDENAAPAIEDSAATEQPAVTENSNPSAELEPHGDA